MSNTEKKHKKPISKILLSVGAIAIFFLAAFAFLILPALTPQTGNKIPSMGSYKKQPIEFTADSFFYNQVKQYEKDLEERGQQVNMSNYFSILQAAFNSSVLRLAFIDSVKRSGYMVTENQIDRAMLPYFTENGVYSPRLFNQTPQATIIEMRKQIMEGLAYQRYYDDIFGSRTDVEYGLKASSSEIPFISQMAQKERSFNIAPFAITSLPPEELVAYGTGTPHLFDSYDMSIITFTTEAQAKKVLAQLKRGEILFSDAVAELSTKQYGISDGKITDQYYYQLEALVSVPEQFQALLAVPLDGLSDIVQTGSTWSIFKLDAPLVKADFTQQATLDAVYAYMASYEAGLVEDYFMNIAKDFALAASTDGFNAACERFSVTKIVTPAFPLNYGNNPLLGTLPAESVLNGAQSNVNFLKTAFSLQPDEISSPLLIGKNIVVLQLLAESESDPVFAQTLEFMYPYYVADFDSKAVESYFTTGKDVKNNVLDVYFKYYLK